MALVIFVSVSLMRENLRELRENKEQIIRTLESSDTKVLLTRRPPHMRTFPNVWVPPGTELNEFNFVQK